MNKLILTLLICVCSIGNGAAQDWKLIFQDDFDGSAFDTGKWSYCPRNAADWGKYLKSSAHTVSVADGNLTVHAIKNTIDPNDPIPYLTGGIQTKGKFNFLYGKIEVRAKFNNGQGAWPAIWLMPESSTPYGAWPNSGEVDIMEHINKQTFVHHAVHTKYIDTDGNKTNPPSSKSNVAITNNDYNVYGLEWYADRLDFFVNDVKTFTYPRLTSATYVQWPFDKPFYIILNQAAGGKWPGSITDADLPFQMEVDWVKVYTEDTTSVEEEPASEIKFQRNGNTLEISNLEMNTVVLIFDYSGRLLSESKPSGTALNLTVGSGFHIIKVQSSTGQVYCRKIGR